MDIYTPSMSEAIVTALMALGGLLVFVGISMPTGGGRVVRSESTADTVARAGTAMVRIQNRRQSPAWLTPPPPLPASPFASRLPENEVPATLFIEEAERIFGRSVSGLRLSAEPRPRIGHALEATIIFDNQ